MNSCQSAVRTNRNSAVRIDTVGEDAENGEDIPCTSAFARNDFPFSPALRPRGAISPANPAAAPHPARQPSFRSKPQNERALPR